MRCILHFKRYVRAVRCKRASARRGAAPAAGAGDRAREDGCQMAWSSGDESSPPPSRNTREPTLAWRLMLRQSAAATFAFHVLLVLASYGLASATLTTRGWQQTAAPQISELQGATTHRSSSDSGWVGGQVWVLGAHLSSGPPGPLVRLAPIDSNLTVGTAL